MRTVTILMEAIECYSKREAFS